MKSRLNRFDEALARQAILNTFSSQLICEDVLEIVDKFDTINDAIKTAVGNCVQAPLNPVVMIGLYTLGKTGMSKTLFKFVGGKVMKHMSTLTGAGTGGTATGTAAAPAGAPAAGVGAVATGTTGAVAGGGVGAYIGFASRHAMEKLGKYFFGFLGACNDYVSKNSKNLTIESLKKTKSKIFQKFGLSSGDSEKEKKDNVDEDYGVALECIDFMIDYENGLVVEGIQGIKDRLGKTWNKLIGIFTDLLIPLFKTFLKAFVNVCKNYKDYVDFNDGKQYAEAMKKAFTDAMAETGLKDNENGFKPKLIMDYFLSLDVVIDVLGEIMKIIVDTIKLIVKGVKKAADFISKHNPFSSIK